METKPFMSKLPINAGGEDCSPDLDLNLPDGRDYRPVSVPVSLEAILRFSEARLAMINSRPGAADERLARMARVKFRL